MPHTGQKRCLSACLLNVEVLASASGTSRRSRSRGTNQSSDPLRRQIEQLHASTLPTSPSTSKAILPQWQLPL